ncbi:copper homeostasis protein CutC [Streptococcus merionis]|uniref:copper homeostasis protein CutC n=1 Tax=Streptococcus merionis TaxID=400065 RepID=UPI0026EE3170|nr:copper homeostasis protein CutC [Streptococcus merionis]
MIIEVCAGSLSDCVAAQAAGADRIELNQALHLGGLTPSLATLKLAKAQVDLPIICMVRPRGAGFCYSKTEKEVMRLEAKLLLEAGADGLALGALTPDGQLDQPFVSEMIALAHSYGADFVFHRAFDVAVDVWEIAEQLIALDCDRILTSGQAATAPEGWEILAQLQTKYGQQMDFCMGAGINETNVRDLVEKTGIYQVHASFKTWQIDPTSSGHAVDYSYGQPNAYDSVSEEKVLNLKRALSAGQDEE